MNLPENHRRPLLTSLVLVVFLIANAQLMQVAAWVLALCYVVWTLLTRAEELSVPRELLTLIIGPGVLLLLGIQGFYTHPLADFGKDCWYFSAPIIYIAFGFLMAERLPSIRWMVYVLSLAGVAVSLQSLLMIYQHRSLLLLAVTAEDYRHLAGIGAGQAMIPAVLIVMCRDANVDLGLLDRYRSLRIFIVGVGSLAILLALSRTLLFVLLVGMAICAGRKLLILAVVLGGFFLVAPEFPGMPRPAATQSFLDKIAHGGQEVELQSYSTMSQINDNWRGFEGYRALKTFDDLTAIQQLVGGGFGTLVDLGFPMDLGGPTEIQELPILHNGYLYLLVKTGFVGMGVFLIYAVLLIRRGILLLRQGGPERRLCGYIFTWSGLTFLLTQGVITGIYNKGALAPSLILLGMAGARLVSVEAIEEVEDDDDSVGAVSRFEYQSPIHGLTAECAS